MKFKEYEMPDGKKAVFEYDENGVGKITLECMDMLMGLINDRKTENGSEKPNNCEHITEDGVTCAKYPACDDCLDNPLNKVKGSKRLLKGKTEPTISKMEQVDEPQTNADQHAQHIGSVESVEPTWTKEEHEAFYTFLWNVINPNEMQDYIGMFETKDEPQTATEIAKAIVHKMIDNSVIAEDAYPDLRQKMHDAVDEYEPQTDCP